MPNPFGRPAGSNPAGGSVEVFEKKIWGELLEKIRRTRRSLTVETAKGGLCEDNVGDRDLAIEILCISPNKVTIKTLRGAVNNQEQAKQEGTSAKSFLGIFPIVVHRRAFPVFGK